MTQVRGSNFKQSATGKSTEERQPLSYLEFGAKASAGFGVVNFLYAKLKNQIDGMYTVKHLRIKDISKLSQTPFDICRRVKQLFDTYKPCENTP